MPAEPGTNPSRRVARVPSAQIGYVNAIVESHEGLCIMRTRDPKRGLVEFWVMRDFAADFDRMIAGLRDEFPIEFLPQEPDDFSDALADAGPRRHQ